MTRVYLVGAGPGAADLLTLKAARLLAEAESVVYDALVGEEILSLVARQARRIYVGKRAGRHALGQGEINDLLVETARSSRGTVVRLKGGDPFVFGRGGEEMQALAEAGIPYEVVPGVTAGIAAPAYCGIPVTHRGLSRSVSLITAATQQGGLPDLDWEALARLGGTLVFYMSMRSVPEICRRLVEAGASPALPAAIISRGTLPTQTLHRATLATYHPDLIDYEAMAPGLLVVGEVVDFAEDYAWHSVQPLAGKRILVTRSEAQASRLESLLRARGAETLLLPTIEITPGVGQERVAELPRPDLHTSLLFTSTNGVHYYMQALAKVGRDSRHLGAAHLAAIGPATAQALRSYGLEPDLLPEGDYTARGLLKAFLASPLAEQTRRIWLPTSPLASGELRTGLIEAGYEVEELHVYHNVPRHYEPEELCALLDSRIDWVTCCSSSAVDNLVHLLELHGRRDWLEAISLAAIGPVTAETIERYGLRVSAMPHEATLQALADCLGDVSCATTRR